MSTSRKPFAGFLGLSALLLAVAFSVPAARAAQNGDAPRPTADTAQPALSVLPSGEIPELRSRSSRTFVAERGTQRLELYASAVNYQDTAGAWQPIDPTLVPALRAGYALRNNANRYTLELPPSLTVSPVRISEGSRWISFALEGAQGVLQPEAKRASYLQALPHVSIDYEAQPDSVKETLVLQSRDAQTSFRFHVGASAGLSATVERRAVLFRDRNGETVFAFAPPFMMDAAGARSEAVNFSLEPLANSWTLTLSADRGWLAAPERRFPVALDPTTFVGPYWGSNPYSFPEQNCSLKNGSQETETSFCSEAQLEVGSEGGNIRRGLLNFGSVSQQLPPMTTVLYAGLELHLAQAPGSAATLDAHEVTRAWTPNTPSWNRYDGVNAWTTAGGDFLATPVASKTVGPGTGMTLWRATELTQRWVNGAPQHGLLVKAANESSGPLFRFATGTGWDVPKLTIRYRHRTGALRQYTIDTQELSDRTSIGVNLANANVIAQSSDLAIAGTGLDLEIGRTYNSRDYPRTTIGVDAIGSVGRGWTLSLGPDVGLIFYAFDGGTVVYFGPSGFAVPFPRNADGSFQSTLSGLDAKLKQNPDTTYTLTFNHSGAKQIFNASGFLIREEDRNGNDIRYSYNAQNLLTQITDSQDRVLTATYFPSGLIEKITDPTGRVIRYGYDASKRLTSFTDAAGKLTTYLYDSSHRLTRITDPLLQQTRITYWTGSLDSAVVTITRVTDPGTGAGSTTTYETCPRGQTVCPPSDPVFDDPERRTYVTDPNGNKNTFYTDEEGRVEKLKDALMREQSVLYTLNSDVDDHFGILSDQTTDFTYTQDGNYNLQQHELPTHATTSWSYDTSPGALHPFYPEDSTDPQGNITAYTYDTPGNLKDVTNALGKTSTLNYNPDGTVKGVKDFKGILNPACAPQQQVTVCYGYDPKGNLTLVDNPEPLGNVIYTYDPLSRVKTVTDGKNQVTTYNYDALDRVGSIAYQGGVTIGYTYDANGNVLTMTDQTGTTTNTYDKLNRLTQETLPGPKINKYTYDAGSNLMTFEDAGGKVSYLYNGVNNVISVTEPNAQQAIVLDYHDDHLRKRIDYPGGVSLCFWYDKSDRPAFAWSQRSTDCTLVNPNPPPRLTDYTYSYEEPVTEEDTGLLQEVTDLGGNATTYNYDPLNRLQQAQTKNSSGQVTKTFAYTYDDNSNRLTQMIDGQQTSYSYNADQLLTAGGTGFTYDQNGNELSASGVRSAATYNAKNQLTSLTPQGQPAIPMSYTGTGQFRRITRSSTSFTNSRLGLTRENTTSYTRDDDGFLLGQRNGGKLYFLYDGLGSVVATSTETGGVSLTASYDPFGGCLADCPAGPHRWLGGLGVYLDTSTSLYKMGTRYYDPALGRFTQVDPVEGSSANPYDYVSQDPINAADPNGTWKIKRCWGCDWIKEQVKKHGPPVAKASIMGLGFATAGTLVELPHVKNRAWLCVTEAAIWERGTGPAAPWYVKGFHGFAGCLRGIVRLK